MFSLWREEQLSTVRKSRIRLHYSVQKWNILLSFKLQRSLSGLSRNRDGIWTMEKPSTSTTREPSDVQTIRNTMLHQTYRHLIPLHQGVCRKTSNRVGIL